jgi:A/G-specific adenine glycosylase
VNALLDWYASHARQLPWRVHANTNTAISTYAVWVSEIMLQQTRVETVIPYFERWMQRFPTIASLAEAPLADVLSTWEGLGYYSRARNMQQAARVIEREHHGELPSSLRDLIALPGIGKYTAGAIASIAFGKDEPALDGNIRRVLARCFDVSEPAKSATGERKLWELARAHLPPGRAGDYNQALMDLGATICTPRSPNCPNCPLVEQCLAYQQGIQEQRPVLVARVQIPHYTVTAAVIRRDNHVLICQRPLNGLLGGMWEFPGGKLHEGETLADCLRREIAEELNAEIEVGESLGVFHHAYTHFRVTLHAFWCQLNNGSEPQPVEVKDLHWVHPCELTHYPMGKIDRQISRHVAD